MFGNHSCFSSPLILSLGNVYQQYMECSWISKQPPGFKFPPIEKGGIYSGREPLVGSECLVPVAQSHAAPCLSAETQPCLRRHSAHPKALCQLWVFAFNGSCAFLGIPYSSHPTWGLLASGNGRSLGLSFEMDWDPGWIPSCSQPLHLSWLGLGPV